MDKRILSGGVKISISFVFTLCVIWVACTFLASVTYAEEGKNLLKNGGFEEEPVYALKDKYIYFINKGWDLGDGPMALEVSGWHYNGAMGPGKIRIIEGKAGKEVHSGQRCLMINGNGVHINTENHVGTVGKEYYFCLYAKGEGKLEVDIYQVGPKEGGGTFLQTAVFLKDTSVTAEWEKYEGIIVAPNPATKSFPLVLVVAGEIYIDDVVFFEKGK